MKKILLPALASLLYATTALSATPDGTAKPTIVLVHGAWETASIWTAVKSKLQRDGYRVQTVDLPGRPGNPEPATQVTMESYRKTIAAAIAPDKAQVVLVGHSFGGFPVSLVAESDPGKIRTVIYLAAYLPQDGQSLLSLATSDKYSKAGPAVQIDKADGLATIAPAARAGLFANDASPQVAAAVARSIVPEPLTPLVTPVHLTASFAQVDKVYIHTARDQVVSPELQSSMVAATPVRLQETLDTGHTPFVTDPNGVANAIEAAIR